MCCHGQPGLLENQAIPRATYIYIVSMMQVSDLEVQSPFWFLTFVVNSFLWWKAGSQAFLHIWQIRLNPWDSHYIHVNNVIVNCVKKFFNPHSLPVSQPSEDARLGRRQRIVLCDKMLIMQKHSRSSSQKCKCKV